jgi:transcriptional regulator with XRE-family HTH domain
MMTSERLVKQLGIVLRSLRLARGLSQNELAAKCRLDRAYVGAVERGEKSITVETAAKLASGLGIRLSDLFARLEQLEETPNKRG